MRSMRQGLQRPAAVVHGLRSHALLATLARCEWTSSKLVDVASVVDAHGVVGAAPHGISLPSLGYVSTRVLRLPPTPLALALSMGATSLPAQPPAS